MAPSTCRARDEVHPKEVPAPCYSARDEIALAEDQLRRYFLGRENKEAGVIEEHLLACHRCALIAFPVVANVIFVENTLNQGRR